jgi:O-antigen/teichoic acid export membrane protein
VRSAPVTVAIGLLSTAIGLLVVPELSGSGRLALGVGALGVAIASPTQDHVRRMLHQAGHSAAAMGVSAVQVVAGIGSLVALATTQLAPIGLPFAALTVANVTSLIAGLMLARLSRRSDVGAAPAMPMWGILRMGWWLLLSTQAEQLSGFAGIAILSHVAGAVAVGQYEAARVLAQPLFVLSAGMQAVFRPRVMAATRQGDRHAVVRYSRAFIAAMSVAGIVATLAVGVPWAGNPLPHIFPNAFEQPGVYAALLLASTFAFCIPIFAVQAIAARRERRLLMLTGTTSLVYVGLVAVLARPLGPLALPFASLGNTTVWLRRFRSLFRSIFGPADPAPARVGSPLLADT